MTTPFYTCGIRDVTFVDEPNTVEYKRLEIYQKPSYDKQHVSDDLDENLEGMIFVYMKGDALAFSNTNNALLTAVFESTNRRRVLITSQKWEAENMTGCCEYDQNYIKYS